MVSEMGKEQMYLPPSVRNSPRQCYRALQNGMTIVQHLGKPGELTFVVIICINQ
jgi:hypothetical protein